MLAIVVLHPTKGREHGSLLQIFFIVGFIDGVAIKSTSKNKIFMTKLHLFGFFCALTLAQLVLRDRLVF
jgi:hypothetical protein